MKNNLQNNYLFRAIEAYPWELEKAIEALNYALSYEPENVKALCLMAKVQSEQLGDYEVAKSYYESAMSSNMENPDIYPDYIRLLVNNEDFEEAQKLIDFAFNVKGVDKAGIYLAQGFLFEATREFEKAEKALIEAKLFGLNNEFITYVDDMISRINKKRKIQNHSKSQNETVPKETVSENKPNWFKNRLNNFL